LRENWFNPADLVRRVPEVVADYPERIMPVDDKAAAILKKRTLTNLYNERPTWLANAHRDLDAAVAAAYGWPTDLTDDQILERLFKLNQERAAKQSG
jgi:type II restriction/modification system DNA methylase subunit YeeA